MKVENAIKKAVEGGYNTFPVAPKIIAEDKTAWGNLFLDPSFWQSLGRSLGWKALWLAWDEFQPEWWNGEGPVGAMDSIHFLIPAKDVATYHWHRLIDHLADGKTAEEFFQSL